MTWESPSWWMVCLALAALAVAAAAYRRETVVGVPATAGRAAPILRLSALMLLLVALVQPARVIRESPKGKPVVALLLDSSESMRLADPTPRWDSAVRFSRKAIQAWKDRYDVQTYAVTGGAIRRPPDSLFADRPAGQMTDLAAALTHVRDELAGRPLAGAVLISDGANRGEADPVEAARTFGAPVHTVAVGEPGKLTDVNVTGISAPEFAFKNTPATLEAVIRAYGLSGKEIAVVLKGGAGGGEVLQTRRVRVPGEGATLKVAFQVSPPALGARSYEISVPPLAGELSTDNNRKETVLQVVREKLRVLYLCGQPSWEYAFLRNFLKDDPSIELVSFIILRNPENIALVPEAELSLIPFPAQDIFLRELGRFDLVIFDNFSYARFFPISYLEAVRRFVLEQGGGFAMLGGDNSFGRGGYRGTPLDDLLPVAMTGTDETVEAGRFRARVPDLAHPLAGLGLDAGEARRAWENGAEMWGLNRLGALRPGAAGVAMHPDLRNDRGPLPVIAAWPKGKGRVLAMASNSTWRWAFGAAAAGQAPVLYQQFWRSAVRWLTQTGETTLVHLALDRHAYARGDRLGGSVRVYDPRYRPASGARVAVTVTTPSGRRVALPSPTLSVEVPGLHEFSFDADEEGAYQVRASASLEGRPLGESQASATVVAPVMELSDPAPNPALLAGMANASGGQALRARNADPATLAFKAERAAAPTVAERKEKIWNAPPFFLLATGCLLAEWYLRRRRGLP